MLERALDLRYRGQSFELTVPVGAPTDPALTRLGARRFHAAHAARYGYARPDAAVELVNVRVTGRGLRHKPNSRSLAAASANPGPRRWARPVCARTGVGTARRFTSAACCSPAMRLTGPALVVQEDATTVLLPGWRATVDAWLNLICTCF